jgi:hypothetical protein
MGHGEVRGGGGGKQRAKKQKAAEQWTQGKRQKHLAFALRFDQT